MTYNGWSNYATWNVGMHLADQYYHDIKEYAAEMRKGNLQPTYKHFVKAYSLAKTTDNVPFIHPSLDFAELEAAFQELCDA
jgi:hypothetical protein